MSSFGRCAGTTLCSSDNATTAAGSANSRFTYRHQRQLAYSVSRPPSSRPIAAPPPAMAPKMPNALARSDGSVKVVVSRPSAAGASSAPKTPCDARALTSTPKLPAAPPIAEATAKPIRPAMKVRLRPKRSPMRPPSRSSEPNASAYAVTTHWRESSENSSARWALGSAMFTIVASSTTISCAMPSTARMAQRRAGGGFSWGGLWKLSDLKRRLGLSFDGSTVAATGASTSISGYSVCYGTHRPRRETAAQGRRAQPDPDPRGRRRAVRRAGAGHPAGRHRPPCGRRRRHGLPALPGQGDADRRAVRAAHRGAVRDRREGARGPGRLGRAPLLLREQLAAAGARPRPQGAARLQHARRRAGAPGQRASTRPRDRPLRPGEGGWGPARGRRAARLAADRDDARRGDGSRGRGRARAL